MGIECSHKYLHVEGIGGAASSQWYLLVEVDEWHFELEVLSDVVRTNEVVDILVNEFVVDSH